MKRTTQKHTGCVNVHEGAVLPCLGMSVCVISVLQKRTHSQHVIVSQAAVMRPLTVRKKQMEIIVIRCENADLQNPVVCHPPDSLRRPSLA